MWHSATAVCVSSQDAAGAARVKGQLGLVIRPMWSNPPIHGSAIAQRILEDPGLMAEWKRILEDPGLMAVWKVELKSMADRINDMRTALTNALTQRKAPGDWSFIKRQIGMFSFTGLTRTQCEHITSVWHVYLTMDGRISMAGINGSNVDRLADAIVDALSAAPAAKL
ncbi:hypothetical protein FOA52_001736 [Chlamydomonas sp. UWO 241]|nr:hypothetical protein FOA52_001736 [Chlamydomonas sp. UWO 241]